MDGVSSISTENIQLFEARERHLSLADDNLEAREDTPCIFINNTGYTIDFWHGVSVLRGGINPILACVLSYEADPLPAVSVDDVPKSLGFIRHTFSMNTMELSKVLYVSRPTIYSWARGNAQVSLSNRRRLSELESYANRFRDCYAGRIGNALREPKYRGRSLIDILQDATISLDEFDGCTRLIVEQKTKALPIGRAKVSSFRELAKDHDLAKMSDEDFRMNVHMLSYRGSK